MEIINKVYNILKEVEYGYCDKYLNKHIDFSNIDNDYRLQTPKELLKSKLGICWDQAELIRYLLEKENISSDNYFIIGFNDFSCCTHTFNICKVNDKYYYIENAWVINSGIYEYAKLEDALNFIKDKFLENFNIDVYELYKYDKPMFKISSNEFINYCRKGKRIWI